MDNNREEMELVKQLNQNFKDISVVETLKNLENKFPGTIVFTTSFGYEDQVITDIIFKNNIDTEVVTLDTGRLFPETYKVYRSTLEKYKKPVKAYFPPADKVEKLLFEKGPFSFYESLEKRKECCYIRKVIPLQRALNGKKLWITGLRASQSENRSALSLFEWNSSNNIIKYNPLLNWSLEEVKGYVFQHNVPYNSLHDRGFVSIGCEPCTRAVKPGESFRAGRWWWEQNSGKECGLHGK
ncbi:MAG: phosphoadenylyl-sulfate reductase [Draconibacterium sp.]|nr:MAG: phosphoadenylyl-sulfate reductase [Draconibacterium sp.]PIF05224.1 MAG: phosphoadenylyl-sulfate reductase [Draconibacterium sp.]